MMRYLMMVVLILIVTSAAFAADDIAATYVYKNGEKATLVTRDNQHVRMNVSPEMYMLLQKGKVYAVSKEEGGTWTVMDMSQMKAMSSGGLAGLMAGAKTPLPSQDKEYTVRYEKTGKKEKIAGYDGVVYTAKTLEGGKIVSQEEIVLCSQDDLKKVNDAWAAMAVGMSDIMGDKTAGSIEKAAKEANAAGYGGILRYGDEMKLESLKKQSLDNSIYQIPPGAEIVNIGAMPGMPQGMPPGMPRMTD